jgi:ABC-type multidrug transport system fused ATPase/permease subunit
MPLAITFGIIGVCFVIGWAATYGSRAYLGLTGLAFIAGAVAHLIPTQYRAARYGVIGVFILLLLFAFMSGVAYVRRRLARLREESSAREQAFFEMLRATEAQGKEGESSPEESPPPAGEEGAS